MHSKFARAVQHAGGPATSELVTLVAEFEDGRVPIGVPLVSEQPAGKIRHHPQRIGAVIAALARGKLGAWRGRADAGSL